MKVFKYRNLMSLLYAILLAIPFISIAVRCIYVQSNKNAKDSYSGQEYTEYKNVGTRDKLILGNTYYGFYNSSEIFVNTWQFAITDLEIIQTNLTITLVPDEVQSMRIYSNQLVYYYSEGTTTVQSFNFAGSNYLITKFKLLSYGSIPLELGTTFKYFDTRSYQFIDNAFEYSLKEITENNNFGELDFFQWFTNMFIDSSKANNQLYVGFINWYLNYTLFVSLGYILFLVIMWFIKLVRQILEKGLSFGSGGSY